VNAKFGPQRLDMARMLQENQNTEPVFELAMFLKVTLRWQISLRFQLIMMEIRGIIPSSEMLTYLFRSRNLTALQTAS